MKPFYRCLHYGPGMTHLHAMVTDKLESAIATGWNIAECRRYAMRYGFTVERERRDDGVMVIEWHEPEDGGVIS
jgi:hypothetical protein